MEREASMDLRQLDYFVHVAELGSFTKAASLLGIAQPALSRQVRSLELELAQTLLYRNGRGVSPTEAGKRLLAHGRGILQQVERAREEVGELKDAPVGHVVVGLPPSVARILAVPLVREFRRRYPRGSIGIVEGLTVYMQEWLMMGRVELALLYNPVPSPQIEVMPFLEEDMHLIRPRADRRFSGTGPIALRELPGHPLIIPSRPHAIRMHVETQLAHLGLKPSIALEIDGVAAILDLVAEGHGYAVLPINSIRSAGRKAGLTAHPIHRPRLRSKLALAVPAQRAATPLARATQSLMRECGLKILRPAA
jgi:LysR family nitrogen assimilation transcriptional regulator